MSLRPPLFLLQNNMVGHLSGPVAEYTRARNYPMFDDSLITDFDFHKSSLRFFNHRQDYCQLMIYGSVQWMLGHSEHLGGFIQYNSDYFNAYQLQRRYGRLYLNNEFQGHWSDDPYIFEHHEKLFLKPAFQEKLFTGGLFTRETWDELCVKRDIGRKAIIAMPAQEIHAEYRCFVTHNNVVEISLYRKDNAHYRERITDPNVFMAAQAMYSVQEETHLGIKHVVMDIAVTPEGYKLVEFNPIHGSGWYHCDVEHVLDSWVEPYLTIQR